MTAEALEKQKKSSQSAVEEDMRQYMRDIRQYPLLTPQEERELARRCAQGDQEAIRKMVNSNLRLVVSVAREYAGRGVPLMDLIQEGSIGLLVAAQKFDYTLDYRFSTYATKWIRQGVTRCLTRSSGVIRVPFHTADRIRRVNAAKSALTQELGREPTLAEIGERSGIPEEKVSQLQQLAPETCSLDAPMGVGEDGALSGMVQNLRAPQPQEELVREELKHTMDLLLDMLTPRQRQVLRLRFGMEDGVCCTQEEIGLRLGVSKERARQLERQAIKKMKTMGADLGLEDFLE